MKRQRKKIKTIERRKGESYKVFLKRVRRHHDYLYNKIVFKDNMVRVTVPGLALQFYLKSNQLIRHFPHSEIRKAASKLIKVKEKFNF